MSTIQQASRWLHWRKLDQVDRNILFFCIDSAFQGLMMGGIFNFLTVFVVRLGASNLQTSLLTALPSLVVAFISIPVGQIVQRKTHLVRYTNKVRVPHRLFILAAALLPFFVRDYNAMVIALIVLWTVKAVSNAFLEAPWMAVAADILPAKRRAAINSTRWFITSLITAGSVFIYGIILEKVIFPLNYQIVFFISFIGGVAGMWFWSQMQLSQAQQEQKASSGQVNSFRKQAKAFVNSVREPRFVRYQISATVLRIALNLPSALFSIFWVRNLGASDLWIGNQGTVNQISMMAGYILWGWFISHRGHRKALLICIGGIALYPILTAVVPSQEWLPAVAIFNGLFITGVNLAFFDTLLGVIPDDKRPSFISVNTSIAYFTVFFSPMLGNFLADHMPIRTIFYISSAIYVVAGFLFWKLNVTED